MSDILIKDMEMPEHCGYCRFRYDGICHALQKTQYSMEDCPLVPVPPHGRLGDLDALIKKIPVVSYEIYENIRTLLEGAPTIIPAEESKE